MPNSHRPTICLIVDNPSRDLHGLVLLAKELADRGAVVYLVPMYSQMFEIPALCPDLVLVNYVRKANAWLMRAYAAAGIAVGVLDTEGGVWESPAQFVKSVNHREAEPYVSLYCLWGTHQRDAFLSHGAFGPDRLVVTGNPRYDFYAPRWRAAIPQALEGHNGLILVLSNFCLGYPKFARSRDVEVQNMVDAGYDRDYALGRVRDDEHCRRGLADVVDRLSLDRPETLIVLRPHPFEDASEYEKRFAGRRNVLVTGRGPVGEWIRQSTLVLHVNSSAAIDAYLLGVPVFTLDWIATDISRGTSGLPRAVSGKLTNFDELSAQIARPIAALSPQSAEVETEIHAWFHVNDGSNAARVADAILDTLHRRRTRPSPRVCRLLVVSGCRGLKSVRGVVEGAARLAVGPRLAGFLRTYVVTRNVGLGTKREKFFSVAAVRQILARLEDTCSSSQRASVRRVSSTDTVIRRSAADAVKISRGE